MLTLTWIELLLGVIPECFVFVYGVHKFSNKPMCTKRVVISALLMALFGYLVRLLPIQFGVHTLIIIMIFIVVSIYINRIEMIKAIASLLLLFIIRLITEWLTFFMLKKMFNISTDDLFHEPVKKVLYTLPSLFMFFAAILVVYFLKNRKWRVR